MRVRELSASTLGTFKGREIRRPATFLVDVEPEIESGFVPAHSGRPAQARIHFMLWVPPLARYQRHVALVIEDTIRISGPFEETHGGGRRG